MADPIVVAHRGANVDLPEQSLAAYQRAIEVGADGIECDLRLTRDGHLVCHHDPTIDRTSDGSGAINDLTLDELLEFDFSGRFAEDGKRHPIVPFATLLELVNDAPRKVRMMIETKHPSKFKAKVEHALHAALERHPSLDVTVMSFARAAVTRYRRLDRGVPLVWIYEYPIGSPPVGTDILAPRADVLHARPYLVDRAHAEGYQVFTWTVNDVTSVRELRAMGVDAIITDDSRMALTELGR